LPLAVCWRLLFSEGLMADHLLEAKRRHSSWGTLVEEALRRAQAAAKRRADEVGMGDGSGPLTEEEEKDWREWQDVVHGWCATAKLSAAEMKLPRAEFRELARQRFQEAWDGLMAEHKRRHGGGDE
jgi:hypothetical protein